MQWSPQQEDALKKVDEWLKSGENQVFRLFGYAGSGKTTLAKHFAENVQGEVLFAAYTGKAAHVLRTKGCEGATTIHSLIYRTKEKGQKKLKELELQLVELKVQLANQNKTELEIEQHRRVVDILGLIAQEKKNLTKPFFTLNSDSVVRNAKLVIVDECSMVDAIMGEDLLSFGTKILVLGDPAQLPPVKGSGFFTENVKPDIMLSEIHRQANDNPIIALATKVRNGNSLHLGQYGSSNIIQLKDVNRETVTKTDQILVGRNKTRFSYNKRLREIFERKTMYPEIGDRLVCLRNNGELGLSNGCLYEVNSVLSVDDEMVLMNISPEEGDINFDVLAHPHYFLGKGEELAWFERKKAEEFDYGYALTCHKSQGSQWDDVTVFDESDCFRQDKNRWLYTAITRAAEKVTIVQM